MEQVKAFQDYSVSLRISNSTSEVGNSPPAPATWVESGGAFPPVPPRVFGAKFARIGSVPVLPCARRGKAEGKHSECLCASGGVVWGVLRGVVFSLFLVSCVETWHRDMSTLFRTCQRRRRRRRQRRRSLSTLLRTTS